MFDLVSAMDAVKREAVKVGQKLEYACRAMMQLGKSCVGDQVLRVEALAVDFGGFGFDDRFPDP